MKHNRCKKCKTMYSICFTGESGHRVSFFRRITTITTKYSDGHQNVSDKEEDLADVSYNEHFLCENCGHRFADKISYETFRKEANSQENES